MKKYLIRKNKTVEEALRIIDKNGEDLFIINSEKKLLGS